MRAPLRSLLHSSSPLRPLASWCCSSLGPSRRSPRDGILRARECGRCRGVFCVVRTQWHARRVGSRSIGPRMLWPSSSSRSPSCCAWSAIEGLALDRACASYPRFPPSRAVIDPTLAVAHDEIIAIPGPSGCGRSPRSRPWWVSTALDRGTPGIFRGEMSRFALARSLSQPPRQRTLKRRLSCFDAASRTRPGAEARQIVRSAGSTSIIEALDAAEAALLADRGDAMSEGRFINT